MTPALDAIPEVDYRQHPAFRELPKGPWSDDENARILDEIRAIDDAFVSLRDAATLPERELAPAFEREVARPARELAQSIARRLAESALGEWVARSIEASFSQLRDQIRVAHRARLRRRATRPSGRLAELASEGCTGVAMPAGLSALLFKLAEPYRRALIEMARAEPQRRLWVSISPRGKLGRAFLRALSRERVALLMADYRGVPMALDSLALHYSHPDQSWFKDCYADVGLETSPLAYLHYDMEPTQVKAIIYLAPDAGPVDGAFRYVSGSHRWGRSEFLFAVRNHLDIVHRSLFSPPDAAGYYRPRFVDGSSRARMMRLPIALHGCSHFGCDLLGDESATRELLARERVFHAVDSCIVFDGGRGLHRGGIVSANPRWALQVGFRPVESLPIGRWIRRAAGRTLRAVEQWRAP